ncbi:MAG: sulfotransferase, partial [Acidimicrobiia bacterium]|nr:sulfotransferase [Acidimicrobiia bacterium]
MSTRVLYIAGTGRSGSTLLARILHASGGVFAGGELRYVWQRGVLEDRLCGCGERFSRCPFWTDVIDRGFGGPAHVDAQKVVAEQRALTRLRQVPKILTTGGGGVSGEYLHTLSKLYSAIAQVSGCELIVDSSKLPSYGCVLGQVPGLDVRFVHLVRDPRGAAYSWTRAKALPDAN